MRAMSRVALSEHHPAGGVRNPMCGNITCDACQWAEAVVLAHRWAAVRPCIHRCTSQWDGRAAVLLRYADATLPRGWGPARGR